MEEKRSFIVTSVTLISLMLIGVRCQGPWGPLVSGTTTVLSTVSVGTPPPTSPVSATTTVLSTVSVGTPPPIPPVLVSGTTTVLSTVSVGTPPPTSLECVKFGFLSEPNRARTYNKSSPVLCDTALFGWYRFSGEAGNKMADYCVDLGHCATSAPGWISGGHPSVAEGVVRRKVCFRGKTKCCLRSVDIRVRNCGKFYVYQLKRPPYCNFRYCGNGITPTSAPTTTMLSSKSVPIAPSVKVSSMPLGSASPTPFSTTRAASSGIPPSSSGCPKQIILNGTSGVLNSSSFDLFWPNQTCVLQITARKEKRIKLVIHFMDIPWCKACSCDNIEIQNGSLADGTPSGRICGYLLADVTYYSYLESLKLLFVTDRSIVGSRLFSAKYTQIDYNVSNECSNYRLLDESNRAVTYVNRSIGNLRDSNLSGWYRFSGAAGSQMAVSCPIVYHCGTDSPGWLSETHPTVADGVVQRDVCFASFLGCCFMRKVIRVRNCGEFYVYKLDQPGYYLRYCGNGLPQAPECSNYTVLNESSRARTYNKSISHSCNDSVLSGWYRFGGDAGSQMAESCVQMGHCDTTSPSWLSGGHPAVSDGAVLRKLCFVNSQGCCGGSIYISVRNCSGFYVYKLIPISSCSVRYCGNGLEPPTAMTAVPSTEPSTKPDTTTIEPTTGREIIERVKITEEGNVTLFCNMDYNTPTWSRRDGTEVQTKRRVLIDAEYKLRITDAAISDSGEYVCNNGPIKHRFIVSIEVLVKVEMVVKVLNYKYTPELQNKSSPVFKDTARNFTREMDKVYNKTPGYIRTEVLNFTKGSVKVDFRVIIVLVATDPKNESVIPDKKAETAHAVVVEAKTGFVKQLQVDPVVEVKTPPLEPRQIKIFDTKSDEFSIGWIPPEDSEAFRIDKYKVQHKTFGTGEYTTKELQAVEGREEYSYRIQNLEPATTYLIRVGAENVYGDNYNEEQVHKTSAAPFAEWIIVLIVLAAILIIAIIIGVVVCLRRKAAEERRREQMQVDARFGGFEDVLCMDSLSRYEEKHVKGLKFSYVNDSFKPSEIRWEEIPYENIILLDELGSGAFGVVYKGELTQKKGETTPCAVKALKASATNEEIRDLYNELEIMTNVGHHPNLVNLLGACTTDGHLLVVLEIAENGSLLDLLKKSRGTDENSDNINTFSGGLSEEMKLRIATDVAKGMAHLASCRCIHRDLAARNVLLGENYVAKVADYGMARDVYEQLMYKKETQGKLPVKWMAIESLETYVFTIESDVWSFGVLLWEIESKGLKPYAGMNTTELITKLKRGYRLDKPRGCSDEMYQVMRDCWDPNPRVRPTFDQLVARLQSMAVPS